MSTLKVNAIKRYTGTTITIGESGDTITITAGATLAGSGASLTALDAGNISAGTLVIARGGTGSTSTTYCDLTANVTGTLPTGKGGTGSTSTTYASLTTNVSGTLPVGNGGTNLTSYAVGDVIYASGTTTLSKLAKPGTPADEVLTFATGASAPSWVESAGGISWQAVQTSTVTAVAGKGYPVNTTAGAITMNLPAGVAGEQVGVVDYAGTFDTNNCTIAANGSEKINGSTDDVYLATEREGGIFTYIDSTQGWLMTSSAPDPGFLPATFIAATGPDGAAGTTDGDYKYHTFTATKTGSNGFSVSAVGNSMGSNTVEYLIVAAGAGAGGQNGGGGGAGGYRTATGLSVSVSDYDVTIGSGGAGGACPGGEGTNGANSVFSTITSTGGGGGSGYGTDVGLDGGSGGGGGGSGSVDNAGGSASPAGQGNDGGTAANGGGMNLAGGGGGAGAVGGDGNVGASTAGSGGNGSSSSITGAAVTRGGGGGGAAYSGTAGSGGSGGGGAGSTGTGSAGSANTGGGGGGSVNTTGGAGGSGVVIIRYKFQ